MENKQNTLAAVLGGITILVIFLIASFFVGQKVKDTFFKTKPNIVTSVTDTESQSLLDNQKATNSGKYKTIPSTGPESLGLILLPLVGTLGIYLKSKSAS